MKKFKKAFTLIEMLVSISIFSVMVLYLYHTYSNVNISNKNLKTEVSSIDSFQKIKKVIYLDFTLALNDTINIKNRDRGEDFVYFETLNSIHRRINPHIVYMVKDGHLFRLESLKNIDSYELNPDAEFDIDDLGKVNSFRVYKSSKKDNAYLVSVNFTSTNKILFKITTLN